MLLVMETSGSESGLVLSVCMRVCVCVCAFAHLSVCGWSCSHA